VSRNNNDKKTNNKAKKIKLLFYVNLLFEYIFIGWGNMLYKRKPSAAMQRRPRVFYGSQL